MMKRNKLSAENMAYIKANYLKISGKQMAKLIGIGAGCVQRFLKKNNLKVPKATISKFRIAAITGRTSYTAEMDKFIQDNYLTMPIKQIGDRIGGSYTGVMCALKRLNLKLPTDVIARNKKSAQIKPGNIPINKGKKQSEYMSPEAIAATKKTRFKKGNLPHNTAEMDGEIRVRQEHPHRNGNRPYKYIRLSLSKWKLYHQHIWEQANGPVPARHCLWFINGDSLDVRLDNLELITRKENRIRNTGCRDLNDKYVAATITHHQPELRQEILQHHPELIEIKRQSILLNRQINGKLSN